MAILKTWYIKYSKTRSTDQATIGPRRRTIRPWLGLAAGLAIFAAAFFIWNGQHENAQVSNEEITDQNYLDDLDEELFQSFFTDESVSNKTINDLAELLVGLEE